MIKYVLAMLLALAACGGVGGGATPAGPKHAYTLIGYGLVNGWPQASPIGLAEALAAQGLTLTAIEWAPWQGHPDGGCSPPSSSATFPREAATLIGAMRQHGITTLVNVVNANGCAQWRQPDAYVSQALSELNAIGPDRVILSVVSEPWARMGDPKAERWTRLGATWPGLFALPDIGANHKRARPYWSGFDYDLLDVHYCSDSGLMAGLATRDLGSLANTDCGTIINPGPERAARFTRQALDFGGNLLIYDFKGQEPDLGVIAAMGAEIQRE